MHIQATRNTIGDLQMTWIPQSRIQGAWRDGVDVPLDPEITGYEIDMMKEKDVVRTLTTQTENITYTAEQQIADFGVMQENISFILYAVGHTVGRGFPASATL